MNEPTFEVYPYDIDRLVGVIAKASRWNTPDAIREKRHLAYFEQYLTKIGATTLVVEHKYVDRDFLEDYAAYYVRCFQTYERSCTRIHFFRNTLTRQSLEKSIAGEPDGIPLAELSQAYLGFMVVKPLPERVIGRTCLTTYPGSDTRSFPAARTFESNLFGLRFAVENTLPFQEQDRVVAACATSALWTVFQATARQFQHQLLSPYEITRAATHLLPVESRAIPNHGLSTQMMALAIRNVALEPFLIKVTKNYLLQTATYCYLHAGIPLLLGVELVRGNATSGFKSIGRHAIAVSGYNLGGAVTPITSSGLALRSSRIDKIYAHDDQLGPFARFELLAGQIDYTNMRGEPITAPLSLSTFWPAAAGEEVRAVPDILLVPLYHKIRIASEWAIKRVTEINEFLLSLSSAIHTLNLHALEWDVYLTTVNEAREQLRQAPGMNGERRFRAATHPMPRFLWRATAYRQGERLMDVFFDATDVDTADALVQVLVYDDSIRNLLTELADPAKLGALPVSKNMRRLVALAAGRVSLG